MTENTHNLVFYDFDVDDVQEKVGTLIVPKVFLADHSDVLRAFLLNVLIVKAEYLITEDCYAYTGYSPMFDATNNPHMRYQVWFCKKDKVLKAIPDPQHTSRMKH